MSHHRWVDVPSEQINDAVARRFITGDSITVGRFELKQGGVVPSHSHVNEQISIVLSGALLFTIDGRETVVKAGEVMQIPADAAHQVEVLEDTLVVDVFSPVRQDWIDKTDTYFKRQVQG
jgi:quercetin dioxygenase-like cupin family protein